MIQIDHIQVSYGENLILQDISFTIHPQRIIMILGENGSGKTTLIKSLLQQVPYTGQIRYDGKDISTFTQRQRAAVFSYVPQIKEAVWDMQIEECIIAGLNRQMSLFATPNQQAYARCEALMTRFHLDHCKGRPIRNLSGGELQMSYVARAFMQEAAVMVMDEPCTYLDFQRQHLFLEATKRLKDEQKSVFISIHDPNLALQYADEILLLHKGRLVAALNKESHDMQKECLQYYNALYGHHFSLAGTKPEQFLVWKEK